MELPLTYELKEASP